MTIRVGLIGLGNIGRPMARNLCTKEFDAMVYDIDPEAVREFPALGARVAKSVAELATHSQLLGICMRDDDDLRAVAWGEGGLLSHCAPGTVIAVHSTVSRTILFEFAEAAAVKGINVIDAPITGGAHGAAQHKLCYMVGGDDAAVEQARPMMATSASKIVHAGGLGAGMALKLCNNLITYLHMISAHQAFRLLRSTGLDPQLLKEVTLANGNLTPTMAAFLDSHILSDPEHSNIFAALAEKDLDCALQLAADTHVKLEAGTFARAEIRNAFKNAT